ncbi:ATP-grasp domain-containing protein [Cellulomonas telluris]|uniref:ATP-grasp domain-containing protein n=1 Tax=Cellulomonas telluris TaxID=2306636 RepID=UPI0010A8BC0C|nr:ATP-grasp domain-containing protein [Cellulomonas telluris]
MHVVIVNRWPRFSDGVRWDNELTRYEEFVDHRRHTVSYVVDGPGAQGVLAPPELVAHQVHVADVNDVEALRAAVAEIVRAVGPVDQLVAMSEFTLEVAARVREDLGIPGPTVADVAPYRDKVRMKEILDEAGVRVPRFSTCPGVDTVLAFAADVGYPVIVKPVDGAASIGVHRVDDESALRALLPGVDLGRYEVEEFVTGTIHHVDGYVDVAGDVPFQVVSRYVNDCLAFGGGAPLGSVVVQRSVLRDRIEDFTRDVVRHLGMHATPFHLELFVRPDSELVFLEIGGRVGGSEVPHLLNRLFGVNLFEIWLRTLTGEPVDVPVKDHDGSGGWLVVPKPDATVRVERVSSMAARVPIVWRELLPQPGDVLEPGGAYDALHSGRFILLDDEEATVEAGIRQIVAEFELEASPA